MAPAKAYAEANLTPTALISRNQYETFLILSLLEVVSKITPMYQTSA